MSRLKDTLRSDLTDAIRSRDQVRARMDAYLEAGFAEEARGPIVDQ